MLDNWLWCAYDGRRNFEMKELSPLMKKLLKNKNVWLVLALLVVCAVVLVLAACMNNDPDTLPADLNPAETTSAGAPAATPSADANLPLGYLLVQRNGAGGWIPLSTGEDMTVSVTDEADENIKNVLHITQNGFYMESSTCDNQDCVDQGEVTLENMSERVLMNMVICLPHQLSVELYSIEQLVEMSVAQE